MDCEYLMDLLLSIVGYKFTSRELPCRAGTVLGPLLFHCPVSPTFACKIHHFSNFHKFAEKFEVNLLSAKDSFFKEKNYEKFSLVRDSTFLRNSMHKFCNKSEAFVVQ